MIAPFIHEYRASRVVFGPGRRRDLAAEAGQLGLRRLLVVTTPEQSHLGREISQVLEDACVGHFDGAAMHVPVEVARRAANAARDLGADGCLAAGGGSAIGLAKAIALETGLPIMAVPTTYAGSEMTPLYGLTDHGQKRTGRDWNVMPRTVVYDPELTTSLPAGLTIASGLNAIAHAAEGLYAEDASPIHKLAAEEGIRALAASLPGLLSTPHDIGLRGSAQYGAWLCGSVLGQVKMGLHHKACHVLGGSFNLPHAETHAVVLPHALAYNGVCAPEAMAALSRALGGGPPLDALDEFYGRVDAPRSLSAIGMPEHGLDHAADLICTAPYPNPRPFIRSEIRAMLQAAFEGATRPCASSSPHGSRR
ncbi:maleylacetate reductase [Paracoccus shandongensis]|uniref:maleylacetate reductase n=1 Tax=Paracoccus shandongensis TaxID=2816048 RepID=UPI001A8CDA9E|nr:maleylacetate reductase [Paracoccus shandongensis]